MRRMVSEMTREDPEKPRTPPNSGGRSSGTHRDRKTSAKPPRPGKRPQKRPQERWEGPWKVLGPYPTRDRNIIYLREVLVHKDTGKRRERYVGTVGRVDDETVHVEGDVPTSIIDDVAHAIAYVEALNLSRRRIADPVKRLLRHFGLQHYTDEKLSATPSKPSSGDKSVDRRGRET